MISRNTLKKDIMKIYGDEKTKCFKSLEKLKCQIAITANMWTSGNNKKGFMAITGHYIEDYWVLQSCILRFIYVRAPRTAKALSQHLIGALIDWNVDQKLSTITVDNCMTNDAIIDRLLEKLPREICHWMESAASLAAQSSPDLAKVERRLFASTTGGIESTIRGGVSGATDASTDDSVDDEYDLFVASHSAATASLKSELDVYLEESFLPRTQNLNVLSWWKINELKYPTLQTMASDILAIPISTVASISVISNSGRLLSPHRNRLHSLTVEALMCSCSWLWKEANGKLS
ncbi:hypothetical protein BUALT_Bualt13G0116900 [Buddleja alternifolia]|uniref:HAT C-terminal dimerisation domain-containing protein n=1 Tax=Buddleja alternifolia TaxID=168488 RepID=A0AAV6WM06_9LAMI|nr:hypothetical protein BUALT_Bualt13G0116900 [Buddleja alternifolia]